MATDKDLIALRIKEIRLEKKLSQENFASSVGMTRGAYSQVELGVVAPSVDLIMAVIRTYGVTAEHLLMGAGNSSNDVHPIVHPIVHPREEKVSIPALHPVMVTVDEGGNENIVFVDQRAAAGYPENIANVKYFQKLPAFKLPGGKFRNGTFRSWEIEGDSMEGVVEAGDWLISRHVNATDIRDSYTYVIVTRTSVLIKQVFNRIQESGKLILKSSNPDYDNIILPIEEVVEVWRGIGYFSFNLSDKKHDLYQNLNRMFTDIADLQEQVKDLSSLKFQLQEVTRRLDS